MIASMPTRYAIACAEIFCRDADGDPRTAAHAALSQPVGPPDGTDENQDQHGADGSGGELQQAAAAQGQLFPGV